MFPDAPTTASVEATTVQGVLDDLEGRWPGFGHRVLDDGGRLRRNLKVFVDGTEADLDTTLVPDAEVVILAAVSGG